MATRTVTVMFGSRAGAERAVDALRRSVSLEPGAVHIAPSGKLVNTGRDGVVVTATVEHDQTSEAIHIFTRHGASEIRHNETEAP